MRSIKRIKNWIAAALSGALFLSNVAFVHATESNFWQERRKNITSANAASASDPSSPLPSNALLNAPLKPAQTPIADVTSYLQMSNIERKRLDRTSKSTGPKTVILIQDVHQNNEAQENISKAITELLKQKKFGLLALEGAFSAIDLKRFQTYPDQESLGLVTRCLLKDNQISGPIASLLTAKDAAVPVVGIDDAFHYAVNVASYRNAAGKQKENQEALARRAQILIQAKAATFNKTLLAYDKNVEQYWAGETSLDKHLAYLTSTLKTTPPAVAAFLEAQRIESKLDFPRVETERAQLFRQLFAKLSPEEMKALVQLSVSSESGTIRPDIFYSELESLCRKKGLSFESAPSFHAYVHYLQLTNDIDMAKIIVETRTLEEAGFARAAKTNDERNLVSLSRQHALTKKLLAFALSKDEWAEYQSLRKGATGSRTENFRPSQRMAGRDDGVSKSQHMNESLSLASAEEFYTQAEIRDRQMAQNLLKALKENNVRTAVLVAGGFHTNGLGQTLEKAGIAIVQAAPRIRDVGSVDGNYLTAFLQKKSPVEMWLSGDQLFLAKPPVTPAALMNVAVNTPAVPALNPSAPTTAGPGLQQSFSSLSETPGNLQIAQKGNRVEAIATMPGTSEVFRSVIERVSKDEIRITSYLNPIKILSILAAQAKRWFAILKAYLILDDKTNAPTSLPRSFSGIGSAAVLFALLCTTAQADPFGFFIGDQWSGHASMDFLPIAILGFIVWRIIRTYENAQTRKSGFLHSYFRPLSLVGILILTLWSASIASALNTTTVKLAWDPNPELDVKNYRVYWSESPSGPFTNFKDAGNNLTVSINVPTEGMLYFVATAINTSGAESDYSQSVAWGKPRLVVEQKNYGGQFWYTLSYTHIVGQSYLLQESTDYKTWRTVNVSASAIKPGAQSNTKEVKVNARFPVSGGAHFFQLVPVGGLLWNFSGRKKTPTPGPKPTAPAFTASSLWKGFGSFGARLARAVNVSLTGLVAIAKRLKKEGLVYLFLDGAGEKTEAILQSAHTNYLRGSKSRIHVEVVAGDQATFELATDWVTRSGAANMHVLLRTADDTMATLEQKAIQNNHVPARVAKEASCQLLLSPETSLADNFMEGVVLSRFEMFVIQLSGMLNAMAIELKSKTISDFKKYRDMLAAQA